MADESMQTQNGIGGVQPIVTTLTPLSEQVGSHILGALKETDCVAILTTIVSGFPADSVVSIPLSSAQMSNVGAILGEVQQTQTPLEDEVCIGFHCALPEK